MGKAPDMNARMSFGKWLKQRRKALDLTQETLAQKLNCAVVTIYKIEADERHPSKQMAQLLAEHLNIPSMEQSAFIQFARGIEFPTISAPWGTPFFPPNNLTTPPNPLIGRDSELKT